MVHAQNSTDKLILSPASITAAATAASSLDTKGADWASIRVAIANVATPSLASNDGVTVKLEESEDTYISNVTTFVANKTGIKYGREIRYEVDTRLRKRYLHLSIIPGTSGVSNETVVAGAIGTIGRKEQLPASTSDMIAGGTNDAVILT